MAVKPQSTVYDGFSSLEGGVESGLPSLLIGVNQTGFAVNCTFRDGGLPAPRPGLVNREMTFPNEYTRGGLEDGLFQGAGTYTSDDGRSFIAASVSGRIFTIEITTGFPVVEITIPDDPNQQLEPHTWFQQAERWLVVQNGLNIPFLFDGAGSRRATEREVPVGGPMAYGKGRLWVARRNLYFGGDVLGGDSSYGRDNVIRFTENDYLAEGGAFGAPDGPITGMAFAKNLDTSLGDGDLLVATVGNIYAFSAPIDRTVWKNLTQPLQRYAAMSFGAMAHESMVIVNGDLFYRSPDGIRTLAYSRRDFQSWGDVPISRSITRGLAYDTTFRLVSGSAVNFDNRALFTTQPQHDDDHGTWHRGLAVLDFHRASGMDRKLAPAWEGVWTGLRILRILTVTVARSPRCFILALSDNRRIQLWELTKSRPFDFATDDIPIEWSFETRAMAFGHPEASKRLMGGGQWFDRILGDVSVRARYRQDGAECWHPWAVWSDCVKYRDCDPENCTEYPYSQFRPIRIYRPQTRPFMGLPQPQDVPDGQTEMLTRDGWEFQVRFEISGFLRFKRLLLMATLQDMPKFGELRNVTCENETIGECSTETCPGVTCCDPDDYSYAINAEDYPGPVYPGDPDYPSDQTYPVYPEYPSVPPPDPGDPGYPGVPESPDLPGVGGTPPRYDPLAPTEDPEGSCDVGEKIVAESNYVWGFWPGDNPNDLLTQAQIECHQILFAIELQALVAMYESLGYTVTVLPDQRWTWAGLNGAFYAMFRKSTCDPNDGIDDHIVAFSGYTTIRQAICVIPPP